MKLLHAIAATDPKMGGVSQALRTMISGLTELGIHNEVVSLESSESLYQSTDLFPIHCLGPGKGPWRYSPRLIPWLVSNLSRFDVVIVHGLWLYHGYAVQKAMRYLRAQGNVFRPARKLFPKVFVMPHGMLDPYFQKAEGRKLKSMRNWLYWKLIESSVVNGSNGELFTCKEECRLAKKTFSPYRPKSEKIVGLGVEEPPCYVPEMRSAFLDKCTGFQQRRYLLYLSRIDEKKGIDLLINAYIEIARKLQAGDTATDHNSELNRKKIALQPGSLDLPSLVVAGPGLEKPYGEKMQQVVRQDPLVSGKIFFPGMLAGEAKWGAFYGCDAFVLPSHQENFGIAVVEAMACGKPVLISNQVNIWREITTQGGGIVADDSQEGTHEMLTKWLFLSEDEKQQMGRYARTSYINHFAVGPAASSMLQALIA
jgi:glycosyltransferase involved in cell wall biosynthesis